MNVRFNHVVNVLALGAAMVAASAASAQSAGQWSGSIGIGKITPKVDSGDVSAPALPGTKSDVGSDTKPVFSIIYGVTDNISAELALGLPFKHELTGAGAIAGTGKLATVEALPPTLFAQYRFFEPKAMVRPYLGVGITYSYFQKATGSGQLTAVTNTGGAPTTFKVDNKVAGTIQLGGTVKLNERWYADLNVTKTYLKTRANFSTGQYQDITLDPQSVNLKVGYLF